MNEHNVPEANRSFVCTSAEDLSQFDSNSFDLYMISFGLRNVPNVQLSLQEALRVLKPGGRYICLEFAKVEQPQIDQIYRFYNHNIIPKVGKLVAGDEESYRYLAESIDRFYSQSELREKMVGEGFENVKVLDMTFGVVALYSAFKGQGEG